jgi:hypothetical protein
MIGIAKKRFTSAIEQILMEELQKGNLPSSKEFGVRITRFLQMNDISKPEYKFRAIRNGEVASSYSFNEVIERIQRDLQTLYDNTIAIHQELKGKFDWFETEKNKVEYEARQLENSLRDKIALYGKTGFLASVFDVFDDVSKVATQDNVVVDVQKHEVILKHEENTSFIFKPQGTIVFQKPTTYTEDMVKRIPLVGNPSNILSGYSNEIWQEIWLTKQQMTISGYLEYTFINKQKLNRIELDMQTIKPCTVMIEFTADNLNWFHLPYYEEGLPANGGVLAFDFPTVEMNAMRVWFTKNENDGEIVHPEGYQFQYVFGAKSLSMYQLRYPSEGTLVSTTLTPKTQGTFSIGKVSLITEEETPVGTAIDYYIATPDNEPLWKQISPVNQTNPVAPQVIDFKYVSNSPAQTIGLPNHINVEDYEAVELATNAISFYRIGSITDKDIIPSTERLYAGKKAWLMKSSTSQFEDAHIPELNDWYLPADIVTTFQSMEVGRPSVIMQNRKHTDHTQYYYGLGIYSNEKEQRFSATPTTTEPIAIYLNGQLLFKGIPTISTQINYVLKNGWNDLVVLIYIQSVGTTNGSTVDIGFDPTSLSSSVYASSASMQKVELFDLQYNVKNNDWTKYAFYEKDGITYVIINYAIPGISYDLFFDYVDKNSETSIMMKAVFRQSGSSNYTTPKLKRYTLQFS